jgi:hypothetical protein
MSDELPTAARVADPGIRALYRLENRWQAWLDARAVAGDPRPSCREYLPARHAGGELRPHRP